MRRVFDMKRFTAWGKNDKNDRSTQRVYSEVPTEKPNFHTLYQEPPNIADILQK